jgi:hypothetical protein
MPPSLRPPQAVADAAALALAVRASMPPSRRGMTPVGLARARELSARRTLSVTTIRRMLSYFARHRVDKAGSTWGARGRGWQSWHGWGGDAGERWARRVLRELEGD